MRIKKEPTPIRIFERDGHVVLQGYVRDPATYENVQFTHAVYPGGEFEGIPYDEWYARRGKEILWPVGVDDNDSPEERALRRAAYLKRPELSVPESPPLYNVGDVVSVIADWVNPPGYENVRHRKVLCTVEQVGYPQRRSSSNISPAGNKAWWYDIQYGVRPMRGYIHLRVIWESDIEMPLATDRYFSILNLRGY